MYEYDMDSQVHSVIFIFSLGEIAFNFFRETHDKEEKQSLQSIRNDYLMSMFWLDFATIFTLEKFSPYFIFLKLARFR